MAEGESAGKGIGGFLNKDTAGLPNWAWLLVIGAGIAAAYIVPKFLNNQSSNQSSTSTGDTSGLGLAIDPTTGLPYAVEGLVPSGGVAPGSGVSPGPPIPPPNPYPPSPGPTNTLVGTIRPSEAQSGGPYQQYDKTHSGVPIRSSASGQASIVSTAAFGSQVTITGNAQVGAPNTTNGDPLWYPVSGGWISASDVELSIQQSGSGGSDMHGASRNPFSAVWYIPSWPGGIRQERIVYNGLGA